MEYPVNRSVRIIIPANVDHLQKQQFDALRKSAYAVKTEVTDGPFESVLTIRGTVDGCTNFVKLVLDIFNVQDLVTLLCLIPENGWTSWFSINHRNIIKEHIGGSTYFHQSNLGDSDERVVVLAGTVTEVLNYLRIIHGSHKNPPKKCYMPQTNLKEVTNPSSFCYASLRERGILDEHYHGRHWLEYKVSDAK